jgi:hypothetical protein
MKVKKRPYGGEIARYIDSQVGSSLLSDIWILAPEALEYLVQGIIGHGLGRGGHLDQGARAEWLRILALFGSIWALTWQTGTATG